MTDSPLLARNLLWNSLLARSPLSGHNMATWGSKCLPPAAAPAWNQKTLVISNVLNQINGERNPWGLNWISPVFQMKTFIKDELNFSLKNFIHYCWILKYLFVVNIIVKIKCYELCVANFGYFKCLLKFFLFSVTLIHDKCSFHFNSWLQESCKRIHRVDQYKVKMVMAKYWLVLSTN